MIIIDKKILEMKGLIEFIESIIQTHMIPGLSIAIVKNNSIVWKIILDI